MQPQPSPDNYRPGLGQGDDPGPDDTGSAQIVELSSPVAATSPSGHHHPSTPGPVAAWCAGFVKKCKGVPGERSLPLPPPAAIFLSGLTAFLGILAISLPLWFSDDGTRGGDVFLLIGSFAATAALVYGAPQAPLSQPRNVVGGHLVGAFIGVAVRKLAEACPFGAWLSAPLSVSVSIMCMQATNTLHPPGAATAMIGAVASQAVARTGWMFIITPALTGAVILVLVAVLGHNATGVRSYPKNWW